MWPFFTISSIFNTAAKRREADEKAKREQLRAELDRRLAGRSYPFRSSASPSPSTDMLSPANPLSPIYYASQGQASDYTPSRSSDDDCRSSGSSYSHDSGSSYSGSSSSDYSSSSSSSDSGSSSSSCD